MDAIRTPFNAVRLGVVGGVGETSSASLYLRIVAEFKERTRGRYPDLVMHSMPITANLAKAFILGTFDAADEGEICDLLATSIETLTLAGATVIALPCNTLHAYLPRVTAGTDAAVLDIVQASCDQMAHRGFAKAALLATTATVTSGIYHRTAAKAGIELVIPRWSEQARVAEAISSLVDGDSAGTDCATVLSRVIRRLPNAVDSVLVACTDLSGALLEAELGMPVVDSLVSLAHVSCDVLMSVPPSATVHAEGVHAITGRSSAAWTQQR